MNKKYTYTHICIDIYVHRLDKSADFTNHAQRGAARL